MWDKIWNLLKKYGIYIVALLLLCLFLQQCSLRATENSISEHNLKTLVDSMAVITLSNDQLLYTNKSLLLENSELTSYLDITKEEKKELEKKLQSKIEELVELDAEIKYDTIIMKDSLIVYNDTSWVNHFQFVDEWTTLIGETTYKDQAISTKINFLHVIAPMTIGFTEDNSVFVTSSNPYIQVTDISSAITNSVEKRWGVGIYAGVGVQYGLINKNLDCGPQVGVGVYYRLY